MKGGMGTNLFLLLFCILFSLRAFGSPFGIEYIATFDFTSDVIFSLLASSLLGAFLLGVGGAIASRAVAGSYSAIYIIPAVAFGAIAVPLISPIGFLINAGIPGEYKMLVMGIIYIMFTGMAVSFIRGGDF